MTHDIVISIKFASIRKSKNGNDTKTIELTIIFKALKITIRMGCPSDFKISINLHESNTAPLKEKSPTAK